MLAPVDAPGESPRLPLGGGAPAGGAGRGTPVEPAGDPVVVAFSVIGVAAVLAAIAFVFYKYIYKQSDARPGRDDNAYGVAFAPLGRDDDDNAYVAPGGV